MKRRICSLFRGESLRLVFATEALSMGVDICNIRRIIHINPPNSLEGFKRENTHIGICLFITICVHLSDRCQYLIIYLTTYNTQQLIVMVNIISYDLWQIIWLISLALFDFKIEQVLNSIAFYL